MKTLAITTVLASLALSAAPAAAEQVPAVEAQIMIDDLDPADPAALEVFEQRVDIAARRLCRTGARDIAAVQLERDCRASFATDAIAQAEALFGN